MYQDNLNKREKQIEEMNSLCKQLRENIAHLEKQMRYFYIFIIVWTSMTYMTCSADYLNEEKAGLFFIKNISWLDLNINVVICRTYVFHTNCYPKTRNDLNWVSMSCNNVLFYLFSLTRNSCYVLYVKWRLLDQSFILLTCYLVIAYAIF